MGKMAVLGGKVGGEKARKKALKLVKTNRNS